jgi:hypothetical protein
MIVQAVFLLLVFRSKLDQEELILCKSLEISQQQIKTFSR